MGNDRIVIDRLLTDEFPYDDATDYETVGTVDYEFPGNGADSGKLCVSIHHISDTAKVKKFLVSQGATGIKVEKIRNRWGAFDVIKFDYHAG